MKEELKKIINTRFVGKEEAVEDVLVCLFAGGHVLLEDVPGVGKTTLAKTLARAVDLSFGRLQFTPDTLPSDVTGLSVYNMRTGEFEFREGAVMRQVILADEINRTSPKTQASLLEAMEEKQVTVDGKVYPLPQPFMVLATQNPVEFLGTFPLPEAQLDRFMMKISVGYPVKTEELKMARNFLDGKDDAEILPAGSAKEILEAQEEVKKVHVSDNILAYIEDIIEGTRNEPHFSLGASPRAMLHLIRASQARAWLDDRDFVKPDDVKAVMVNTLHHRMQLTAEAKLKKESTDRLLQGILTHTAVPTDIKA